GLCSSSRPCWCAMIGGVILVAGASDAGFMLSPSGYVGEFLYERRVICWACSGVFIW
ncbi:hypothetical protein BHE74_00034126, partial [Ensete ventricosum]